ncbi:MAG: peptidylprolyl isomerase [Rhodobacteraceae bacterium]|jgi:peptidyl-prolyl cis-trans isomerase SurA|nr:peptidylprolyl isomerase [Paracoccaceae bacterium]
MRPLPFLLALIALAGLAVPALGPAPAAAQANLFTPRVIVNDGAITHYEVTQRRRFIEVIGVAGDLDAQAVELLIEDKLRLQAAAQFGVRVSEDQIQAGMAEFASRASLTTEQFLAGLAERGVAADTFRFFVEAGVAWREVVRLRFAARAAITEAEVDRALALTSRRGAARVLLSELLLPATEEYVAESRPLAARLARSLRGEGAFAAAARQYSVSASREQGGRLDWLPLSRIPAEVATQILALAPGEVTQPIQVGNVIALFLLRAIDEGAPVPPESLAVEYAQFFIPGAGTPAAAAEAARIRARVDRCDDLYGIARGLPEDRLLRETRAQPEVPADIALELARLDDNEVSLALVRGDALVFLMLCGRTAALPEAPAAATAPAGAAGEGEGEQAAAPPPVPLREEVRQRLVNQRLGAFADGYLAELRADAHIVIR